MGVKGLMIILLDLELLSTKNMLEENGPIGKKLLWDVFGNKWVRSDKNCNKWITIE